jgi:hypothetical protein
MIDWSWELATEPERIVLRRLVDRSLVEVTAGDAQEPRYRLLESTDRVVRPGGAVGGEVLVGLAAEVVGVQGALALVVHERRSVSLGGEEDSHAESRRSDP